MRVFGTKSTTYSAPRYNPVWPRWRPKPLTSVTVMPETPISESAARTSSSLKGLIMAVINFIFWTPVSVGPSRQYYYDCTQQARPYAVAAARRGCCVQSPFRGRPRPAIKTGGRRGEPGPQESKDLHHP